MYQFIRIAISSLTVSFFLIFWQNFVIKFFSVSYVQKNLFRNPVKLNYYNNNLLIDSTPNGTLVGPNQSEKCEYLQPKFVLI